MSWDGGCEYWRDGYCERMEVFGLMRDVMEVSGDVLLLARKERPTADDVVHEVNARRLADVLVAIPDALLENTLNMVVLRRELERQSRSLRTRGGVSGRRCCGLVDKVELEDEKPRAEKQSREEISSSCLFVIFHSF